jgi:hypothetical protein
MVLGVQQSSGHDDVGCSAYSWCYTDWWSGVPAIRNDAPSHQSMSNLFLGPRLLMIENDKILVIGIGSEEGHQPGRFCCAGVLAHHMVSAGIFCPAFSGLIHLLLPICQLAAYGSFEDVRNDES